MLKKNIGLKDRGLRLIIALLLFAYAYWKWSLISLLFALFTLCEALFSWCVFYALIGKNSCPIDRSHQK